MTKYCTECGTENLDEANFCSKCGLPFDEYDHSPLDANAPLKIPKKYNEYNIKETSICFNCKQNTLIQLKKDSLLSDKIVYFCTNCGMTLEKSGKSFRLVDILDKNNPLMQYGKRQLKMDDWMSIANGGLSNKDQTKQNNEIEELREKLITMELKRGRENIIQSLSKGEINLVPIDCPADLRDNETAYLSLADISLSEPKISKKTSFEDSFKLSKGVALKSRAGTVSPASHDMLNEVDIGTFIITSQRVIFAGGKKTVKIDLRKILSINVFSDGVSIVRENKKHVEYFLGTDQYSYTFTLEDRQQNLNLEGNIIRAMILGQIANL